MIYLLTNVCDTPVAIRKSGNRKVVIRPNACFLWDGMLTPEVMRLSFYGDIVVNRLFVADGRQATDWLKNGF